MARFEFVNDTIQELFVQTYSLTNAAIKEMRVLRQTTSPVVAAGDWTAVAVTLGFSGLVGTLPPSGVFLCGTEKIQYGAITWTSPTAGSFTTCKRGWESTTAAIHVATAPIYFGDAFAWITDATVTADAAVVTIPFARLDRPGSIPETGIIFVGDEWIYYGGVTYTDINKTAGNLIYCFREYNGTTLAAHDGSVTNIPIRFEHIFTHREYVALYNYIASNVPVYFGYNPTITNAGVNSLFVDFDEGVTIPLGPRNRVYAISSSTTGYVAIAEWR